MNKKKTDPGSPVNVSTYKVTFHFHILIQLCFILQSLRSAIHCCMRNCSSHTFLLTGKVQAVHKTLGMEHESTQQQSSFPFLSFLHSDPFFSSSKLFLLSLFFTLFFILLCLICLIIYSFLYFLGPPSFPSVFFSFSLSSQKNKERKKKLRHKLGNFQIPIPVSTLHCLYCDLSPYVGIWKTLCYVTSNSKKKLANISGSDFSFCFFHNFFAANLLVFYSTIPAFLCRLI